MKKILYISLILLSFLSCNIENSKEKNDKYHKVERIHHNYDIITVNGIKFLANREGGLIELKKTENKN